MRAIVAMLMLVVPAIAADPSPEELAKNALAKTRVAKDAAVKKAEDNLAACKKKLEETKALKVQPMARLLPTQKFALVKAAEAEVAKAEQALLAAQKMSLAEYFRELYPPIFRLEVGRTGFFNLYFAKVLTINGPTSLSAQASVDVGVGKNRSYVPVTFLVEAPTKDMVSGQRLSLALVHIKGETEVKSPDGTTSKLPIVVPLPTPPELED